MGWERKRGKLHELNRLLRGATDTTFVDAAPDASPWVPDGRALRASRSTPTRACRARRARRLVGKMAHPLNRPRFDARRGRVVEGYAVLQPRVTRRCPMSREGVARSSASFSSAAGHRSVRRRGLRRLPGPVRRRLVSPARASTTSTPSKPRSPIACRRARCSATTCSKASSRAPASSPTSKWSRNSRRATTWPPRASIAGRAATGSCCRGSSAGATSARGDGRGHGALPLIGLWKMLDNLRRTLSAPASLARAGRPAGRCRCTPRCSGPASSWRVRAADPAAGARGDRAAPRRRHRCAATCARLRIDLLAGRSRRSALLTIMFSRTRPG